MLVAEIALDERVGAGGRTASAVVGALVARVQAHEEPGLGETLSGRGEPAGPQCWGILWAMLLAFPEVRRQGILFVAEIGEDGA